MSASKTLMLASVLCAGLISGSARADAPLSCRDQVSKLCGSTEPGQGRKKQCLAAHFNELTPDCQAKLKQREETAHSFKEACAQDMKEKCADVVPGGGRELLCLKAHEPTLSVACHSALPAGHEHQHGEACAEDVQSLCAGVKRGGGRIQQCLEAHVAQLSPRCSAKMARRNGAPGGAPPAAAPPGTPEPTSPPPPPN